MQDFENAFSEFIDCREYDEAESALFSIIRAAFKAGWRASGGEIIESQNVLELLQSKNTSNENKKCRK